MSARPSSLADLPSSIASTIADLFVDASRHALDLARSPAAELPELRPEEVLFLDPEYPLPLIASDGETVRLQWSFVRFLVDRGHLDVFAALLAIERVQARLAPAVRSPSRKDMEIELAGRGFISSQSRIDDIRDLFAVCHGQRSLDARGRQLFARELLLAGETLTPDRFRERLSRKFGPICLLVAEEELLADLAAVGAHAVPDSAMAFQVRSCLDHLGAALRSRRLWIFAGAGLSVAPPAAAPDWFTFRTGCFDALLQRLVEHGLLEEEGKEELLGTIRDSTLKPEIVMEMIHRVVGARLFNTLSVLQTGAPNANHRFLARAARDGCLRGILTTNFDTYVEAALEGAQVPYRVILTDSEFDEFVAGDLDGLLPVIKLHGTLSSPESLVMTLNSAARPLSGSKRKALGSCLAQNPVLFLGYSANDADLYPVLHALRERAEGIVWCFRGFERTPRVDHLLGAYGDRARSLEMNVDRLLRKLAFELSHDSDGEEQIQAQDSQTGRIARFRQWAEALEIHEVLEIVGRMLAHEGKADEARQLLMAGVHFAKSAEGPATLCRLFETLGDVDLELGEPSEAEGDYKMSMHFLIKENPSSPEFARLFAKLGLIESEAGNAEGAERLFGSASLCAEQGGDLFAKATVYEGLGDLRFASGDRRGAFGYYRRAAAFYGEQGEVFRFGAGRFLQSLQAFADSPQHPGEPAGGIGPGRAQRRGKVRLRAAQGRGELAAGDRALQAHSRRQGESEKPEGGCRGVLLRGHGFLRAGRSRPGSPLRAGVPEPVREGGAVRVRFREREARRMD